MNIKILATEKFENKLNQLDKTPKGIIVDVLNKIKVLDANGVANYLGLNFVFGQIQFFKVGILRIFINFTNDSRNIPVLVFLDLTLDVAPVSNNRNPRFNNLINPRFNNLINPRFNNLINPRFNNLINPRFNNLINPRFNNLINPRFNNLINPRFNNLINPRFNNLINPRFNNLINPRFNANFIGYYNYDLNCTPYEFVIFENSQNSLLFFDFSAEQTKFAIKHSQNGYMIFDINNEWIGHLESDSQNGYNYFDLNSEWVGFLK